MAAADLTQGVFVYLCGGVCVAYTQSPSPSALAQNCRLSSALRVWLKFHFFMCVCELAGWWCAAAKTFAISFPDLVPGKITFAQRLPSSLQGTQSRVNDAATYY